MNTAIIGAGYLGEELTTFWSAKGFHVTIATWHAEWAKNLSSKAQKCVFLRENSEDEILSLLINNEVIVVTLSVDAPASDEFLQAIRLLRKITLKNDLIRTFIFAGTTAVYGDYSGLWVDELGELRVKTEHGKILVEMERLIASLKESGSHVCIFRMAELYGPGRSLLEKFRPLAGQTLTGYKESFSNMVHRDDAIAAIDYAVRHRLGGVYNLSDDEHPTIGHLYDQIATHFHLPKPIWNPESKAPQLNKRISNHKIKGEGFAFRYPHRILN